MSLTNNTGSRVTSNEEPLTGQSGPVNLASKMAPKEKTNSKEKKRRQKKVRDIQTVSSSQPHRIQPEGHKEPNLFLECLLANQPKSTERNSSLNQIPPCLQPRQETVQPSSACVQSTRKDSTFNRSGNLQPIVPWTTNNREGHTQSQPSRTQRPWRQKNSRNGRTFTQRVTSSQTFKPGRQR